jgi:O-antigen/teichoic acid export membrane protein
MSLTVLDCSIVKTALGPLLVVLGFGVLGAIYAAMASVVAGGVISIIVVYFVLFRSLRKCKNGGCDIKANLKPMLQYGLPLTVATIVIGIVPQIIALAMSFYSVKGDYAAGNPIGWMMGNYFAAANFAVLLTFVSVPISTALFPVFSKLNPESEPKLVQTVFTSSTKYTSLLLFLQHFVSNFSNSCQHPFSQRRYNEHFFVVGAAPKFPYTGLAFSVQVNLFVSTGNKSRHLPNGHR